VSKYLVIVTMAQFALVLINIFLGLRGPYVSISGSKRLDRYQPASAVVLALTTVLSLAAQQLLWWLVYLRSTSRYSPVWGRGVILTI